LVLVSIIGVISLVHLVYQDIIEKRPTGTPMILMIVVYLFITILYQLSKRGHSILASTTLVLFVLTLATYMSIRWGVSIPLGLLFFGLSVSLAGILLNSTLAFLLIILNTAVLLGVFIFQSTFFPDVLFKWRTGALHLGDVIVYACTLALGGIVAGISNKTMEQSLRERNDYAIALEKEKNSLDQKVKSRTKELEEANQTIQQAYENFRAIEKERIIEINKQAAVGKIATGLLHDVSNSVTYVSAAIRDEAFQKNGNGAIKSKSHSRNLQTIEEGLKALTEMLNSTKKIVKKNSVETYFYPGEEIQKVLRLFSYSAKKKQVSFHISLPSASVLHGDPVKFFQCLANLIANAIEAYATTRRQKKRSIWVRTLEQDNMLLISVSDNASGIKQKNQSHMFEPFFTTKHPQEGTGIGLCEVKEIMEQLFHGSISFESTEGKGTTFWLKFPLLKYTDYKNSDETKTSLKYDQT